MMLSFCADQMSVKATTTERMGYEGRGGGHQRPGGGDGVFVKNDYT